MIAPAAEERAQANQEKLMREVAAVRELLERRAGKESSPTAVPEDNNSSTVDEICKIFGLSSFERSILVLCAAVELDSSFPALCAAAQGDSSRAFPTFSLALSAFPDAHWSALASASALRRWHLIELAGTGSLTLSPLRIDERVLSFLTGVSHLDERLTARVEPLSPQPLSPLQRDTAAHLRDLLMRSPTAQGMPAVQLTGEDSSGKRAIAAQVADDLGWNLFALSGQLVPSSPDDLDLYLRLWEREAALGHCVLLIDWDAVEAQEPARNEAVSRMVERYRGPLFVAARQAHRIQGRFSISVEVNRPSVEEQRQLWTEALDDQAERYSAEMPRVLAQFHFDAEAIRTASREARFDTKDSSLWEICRHRARPRMEELAQRITALAGWDALVLPDAQKNTLREIVAQARNRVRVYTEWGFGERSERGLGVTALFSGPSGTGKTMAAEVLARELNLDLFRIDLSQVVSKYIGETEKSLRRVFDAAEEGGVVLLFDEADALFGKRSEVKDSHDRYANIEVSYLLQRMESYRGLAVLTTNLKSAIDQAFLRRLRFVVQFPFPDATLRAQIWRRAFPERTPIETLNIEKLAKLNITGGNIQNIAMSAAFLAAEANKPVSMTHLASAARTECSKLERPLAESELGGWV